MALFHDEFEQYSDEFWKLRNGKPTASVADKLITSTGKPSTQYKDLSAVLAGDLFAGKALDTFDPTPAMQRGTDLEEAARNYYSMATDNDVEEIGFVTDDLMRVGASPDGLIKADNGLLEIKNLGAKNHIKALDYYAKHNKQPTTYVAQVQFQLMICEADYCDLLYHYPEDLPSLIIRVKPDLEFHQALKQQIILCLKERDRILAMLKGI